MCFLFRYYYYYWYSIIILLHYYEFKHMLLSLVIAFVFMLMYVYYYHHYYCYLIFNNNIIIHIYVYRSIKNWQPLNLAEDQYQQIKNRHNNWTQMICFSLLYYACVLDSLSFVCVYFSANRNNNRSNNIRIIWMSHTLVFCTLLVMFSFYKLTI